MKKLSRGHIYTPTNLNSNILRRLSENDTCLRRIKFSSYNIGSYGVTTLSEVLRYNTNLTALDLSSNSIGVEGAKSLAKLLKYQSTMMSSSSSTSSESCNSINVERGIKTLMLCDNNLRNEGMKVLADALEGSIIEHLWIDDNCIGASGLSILTEALKRNTKLTRLHLRHNTFQSLQPLIECTFNKQSLQTVADSNHTLKHVFLNCGYSYECEEVEVIMRINRLGKVQARRRKIALYLEEDLGRLLELDMDTKVLPHILAILAQHGNISTMLRVMQNIPSVLSYHGMKYENDSSDEPMDIEYLS